MKFGEKLKKLRAEKGLTQQDVSEAIGVSRRTYVSYEQEGRYPRKREIYVKLADAFKCDVNYLMTEDEEFVTSSGEKYGNRGKRQAEELVAEISGMFAGGDISEEDKDAVFLALQRAYVLAKEVNRKYIRSDYRKED